MFKLMPYKSTSSGAKILCRELPAEMINADDRFTPNFLRSNIVLNWGCGWSRNPVSANQPAAVCNAVNKVRAFKLFDANGVAHPEYTRLQSVAKAWYQAGHRVYHRETIEGERGRGITIIDPDESDEDGIDGGLERFEGITGHFTRGFPIHREFRVHVAFGKVIEVNEKKRRNGTNPDPRMRSDPNWVFCVYNLSPYPDVIKEQSIAAVAALGLDFGGVDVAIDKTGTPCVFEVNTAPWINRESTWTAYGRAFTENYAD